MRDGKCRGRLKASDVVRCGHGGGGVIRRKVI